MSWMRRARQEAGMGRGDPRPLYLPNAESVRVQMEERKSWSSSPAAKSPQATFECLAQYL